MAFYREGDGWRWGSGWEGMLVYVDAGGRPFTGVVFERGLSEQFGAWATWTSRAEAYLRNKEWIQDLVREMALAGKATDDGFVLVKSEDLADYMQRKNITPEVVFTDPVEHSAGT